MFCNKLLLLNKTNAKKLEGLIYWYDLSEFVQRNERQLLTEIDK